MNIVQDNVAQILVHFTKQKQQILEELQEQREETEKQLKQYEALQKSIMAAPTPDIVGGQIFATSRKTLLSEDNTFFSAIVGTSLPLQTDEDDAIFIDRDPVYFAILLQYLRDRKWNWNIFSKPQQRQLQKEIEFYAIGSLLTKQFVNQHLFAWDRKQTHPSLILSNDNRTATGKAPGDVIADKCFTSGMYTWYITIHPNMDASIVSKFASQFYIGVGDAINYDINTAHYNTIYGIASQGGIYEHGVYKDNGDASWAKPDTKVKVELDCEKQQLIVRGHLIQLPACSTGWYPMVVMGWYNQVECMTLSFE